MKLQGMDMYKYWQECGFNCIGSLSIYQNYMNTLSFDYTPKIRYLEKMIS